jgi:hypothetical protein
MKTTIINRDTTEITATTTGHQALREEALIAREMVEVGYMKFARCLYDIYIQNVYKTWDYPTFENYVDVELQINYRKAMYLIEIYNKATMLNMDMARLEKLGWTKARELIRIVDQTNSDEWMSIAENSSVKELSFKINTEKDIQEDRASVMDEVPTITTITFKLGMAEKTIISDALEESARLINSEDLALALTSICETWLELKGIVPLQTSLEDRLSILEKEYGRKIVIAGIASSTTLTEEEEEDDEEKDEFEELI